MPKIFITGGAGYIGSVTNQELKKTNFDTVIFDSLESGHDWAIKGTTLIKGNLLDQDAINSALKKERPDAVIHFAGYIEMGESYTNPAKYYRNNVGGTLNLLEAMVEAKVKNIIFSSSAGVYGSPKQIPIKEDDPKNPQNSYGQTKLDIEHMLSWFEKAHGLKHISLRYFNAAGATLDASLGEAHQPESHIIPLFLGQILKNQDFAIFGDDYRTPDGTCVRDYVHVLDLASAHINALKALLTGHPSTAFNIGTGLGYSNKQIAEKIIVVTKTKRTYHYGPRRPGDVDSLVADSTKIQQGLDWKPKHSDLDTIIRTAFAWHQALEKNRHFR